MISALALIVAAIIPLGFLYAISTLDFYHQKENARFIAISGVWGITAYFLAARINPALVSSGIFSRDTLVRFIAPIIEEILKGLILLYLIRQPAFKYFLDGAIYGYRQGVLDSPMLRLNSRGAIPGLYNAGAWTNLGGGYEPCISSGRMAAAMCLKDLNREGK